MYTDEAAACLCAGEWTTLEAHFRRARQALIDAQQRHCDAAQEFFLARAQVRQRLEAVFPGDEAASGRPADVSVLVGDLSETLRF